MGSERSGEAGAGTDPPERSPPTGPRDRRAAPKPPRPVWGRRFAEHSGTVRAAGLRWAPKAFPQVSDERFADQFHCGRNRSPGDLPETSGNAREGSRHPSRRDRTQMFPEACRPNRSDPPSAARRPVREIDPSSPLAELVPGRQALGPGPIARTGSRPHPRETPVPRGFGMALRVEPRAPARPGRELASRATRCRQARDRDPGQDARLPSHGRASATPRELARVRSHPGRRPPSCLVHSAPVRPLRLRTAGMNPLAPWPGASQHAR